MKYSFRPFGAGAKPEIVEVGGDVGGVYLEKLGYIRPIEDPIEAKEAANRIASLIVIRNTAIKRAAEKLEMLPVDVEKAVDGAGDNGLIVDINDYLSPDEQKELISLQLTMGGDKAEIATLMLQYRLAFHVKLTEDAKAKAASIDVEPLRFPLAVGNVIQLGDYLIKVNQPADPDATTVYTDPLPIKFSAGESGFLCGVDSKPRIGLRGEWTLEHTKTLLSNEQVDAIYSFYQEEKMKGQSPKALSQAETEAEGKAPEKTKKLKPSSDQNLLTGSEYTTESKDLESVSQELAGTASGTSQPGG